MSANSPSSFWSPGRNRRARSKATAAPTRAASTVRAIGPWVLAIALILGGGATYKRTMSGPSGDGEGDVLRQALPVDPDPVVRFQETRIGQLLFMEPDGRHCRRVLFDNVTGGFRDAGSVECVVETPDRSNSVDSNRIDAIRNSFNR